MPCIVPEVAGIGGCRAVSDAPRGVVRVPGPFLFDLEPLKCRVNLGADLAVRSPSHHGVLHGTETQKD
jgi:hypothetical protein